ncbi:ABC transporter permease [Micromonospora sp. DT46]|uniref:ABC transporter permease n=1 Tax=Micromonospora sp. DT46 TaxID=3393435 RepID=UPI003CEBDD06
MNPSRIIFRSAAIGFAELPTTYTVRSWLGGWVVRLTFQVVFFTLLGQLAGSTATAQYVLLGNVVALVAVDAMYVATTAATELYQNTFPMVVASPTNMGLVYLGRGLHWACSGVASACLVFVGTSLVFPVPWHWWMVLPTVPLLALVGLSTYLYACVAAALALRHAKFRTVFANLGFLLLATFCGVNVPISFWPAPVSLIAELLPLTHGLSAVRAAVAGDPLSIVLTEALAEAGVAVGWAVLVLLLFERLAARGRRDGSLNFTS